MVHTPGRQPVRQIVQRHSHDCATGTASTAENLAGRAYDLPRLRAGGSAAGDLAGAILAQDTQVDGGPGAVGPPGV